jgi:hypothetical protein
MWKVRRSQTLVALLGNNYRLQIIETGFAEQFYASHRMGPAPICLKISARIAERETYRMIPLKTRLFSHWSIHLSTVFFTLLDIFILYSTAKGSFSDNVYRKFSLFCFDILYTNTFCFLSICTVSTEVMYIANKNSCISRFSQAYFQWSTKYVQSEWKNPVWKYDIQQRRTVRKMQLFFCQHRLELQVITTKMVPWICYFLS